MFTIHFSLSVDIYATRVVVAQQWLSQLLSYGTAEESTLRCEHRDKAALAFVKCVVAASKQILAQLSIKHYARITNVASAAIRI